jgi:hypothetical protein
MKITNLFLLCAIVMLISCSAKITSSFLSQEKPLTLNDKVAFLDVQHNVPEGAKKLGEAKFGDSGFSTDCDFNSNLIKARVLARKNGANIVKITEKKAPDFWSSCYRLKIEFYLYKGDVTTLRQYQLQIN